MPHDIPLSLAIRALRVLHQQGPLTRYELAGALDLSDRHALRVLQTLSNLGWAHAVSAATPGPGRHTRYRLARATISLRDLL